MSAAWDNLVAEAERLGEARAQSAARRLAQDLRESHPDLAVRLLGDAVEIRGRALRERRAHDPALRWPGR